MTIQIPAINLTSNLTKVTLFAGALFLGACTHQTQTASAPTKADTQKLTAITQNLPAEHKARHAARHPVETLAFFGIKPGDTVVEVLPGDGWYSQILVPYLGKNGQLIGVDYTMDLWPKFGSWVNDEFLEGRKRWPTEFTANAKTWGGTDGAATSAYTFANLPKDLTGKVDAVLFIRALHNLNRFEKDGKYLTTALSETHRVLKPDGVVGVVAHAVDENRPDAVASGESGYMKRSTIVAFMDKAGFKLVDETDINKNPKDIPQAGENVWRLPPNLAGAKADKAKFEAIGESNRVTLLFKKR